MTRGIYLFLVLLVMLGDFSGLSFAQSQNPTDSTDKAMTIKMEDCDASRTRAPKGILEALLGRTKDQLAKRGIVEVEGVKYTLYLPKEQAYSVKNTAKKDNALENTSTQLTIDQKTDNWFANLPIRLGDKMFDVISIDADGSRIDLKPSKSPLRGALIGRICPPFSFKAADDKEISRDSLLGKAFLLDIWSVT